MMTALNTASVFSRPAVRFGNASKPSTTYLTRDQEFELEAMLRGAVSMPAAERLTSIQMLVDGFTRLTGEVVPKVLEMLDKTRVIGVDLADQVQTDVAKMEAARRAFLDTENLSGDVARLLRVPEIRAARDVLDRILLEADMKAQP